MFTPQFIWLVPSDMSFILPISLIYTPPPTPNRYSAERGGGTPIRYLFIHMGVRVRYPAQEQNEMSPARDW